MISNDEYLKRKWGHLPALKKVIEKTKTPGIDGPVLSTSDSDTQRLGRIAECALTLHTLIPRIRESSDPEEVRCIVEDLSRLSDDLRWASGVFHSIDDEMCHLRTDMERRLHR